MVQESANSEDGATDFNKALAVREAGSVNHRADAARWKDGDAITGRSQLLNHERYRWQFAFLVFFSPLIYQFLAYFLNMSFNLVNQ